MLTNNEEYRKNGKTKGSQTKWTRKQARGILTANERTFLQGKESCSPNMRRYFRSHILRKATKAVEDLDLIFKTLEVWQIFIDDKPSVEKLMEEAAKLQYYKNYRNEFQRRLQRKVKRQIDKEVIIQRTKEQLDEIMISVLADLQTKKP